MTANVREAAELLRNGFNYAECPDQWSECNCARALAAEWLREHPADDEEVADEAWLRGVLPCGDSDGMQATYRGERGSLGWTNLVDDDFSPDGLIMWVNGQGTDHRKWTRGQVRTAARLFGVSLPAPPAPATEVRG
jgi:hypothetical protein